MNYYFIGSNKNWGSTSSWATYSGGSSSGIIPGSLDSVVFDLNSGNCILNSIYYINSIDFTNYTQTFNFEANTLYISGSMSLGVSMSLTHSYTISDSVYNYSSGSGFYNLSGGFAFIPSTASYTTTNINIKTNGKYIKDLLTFGSIYNYNTSQSYNLSINLLDTLNCDILSLYSFSNLSNSGNYGIITFTGSYGFNTLKFICLDRFNNSLASNAQQSGTYILNSGITYSISNKFILNCDYVVASLTPSILQASNPNIPANINIPYGTTTSVSNINIIGINFIGKTIRVYNGSITQSQNCVSFNYTDLPPVISGFCL